MATKKIPLVEKTKTPPSMFQVLGRMGESLVDTYTDAERRVDELKLSDYRRMLDNDGQIQMLYNAIVNTILSAGFTFQDDAESEAEEDSPELVFVESVFNNPYWKDGMKYPMTFVMREMLRAFIDGYRAFEIVYKIRDDGLIGIDKIAPRGATTENGIVLLRNNHDEFYGLQQTIANSVQPTVRIVNDGSVSKVIKSTFGEEFGSLYGRSGFKAAWYHYDKAHKSMFLNHVGHELGAIKFRKLMSSTGNTDLIQTAMNALERTHEESVINLPKDQFELTFESASDASVMGVGLEQQDRHYSLMAKSLLAQFSDLGSSSSSTGSRSLGETQVEFFKQGLQNIASILIEQPVNLLISDLIRVNFNKGLYPTIKINSIDDKASAAILEGFMKLIDKGTLPDSVQQDIISKTANKLNLDVDDEVLAEEFINKQNMEQDKIKAMQENKQNNFQQKPINQSDHIHLGDGTEPEFVNDRPLFPDEYKIRFADIKQKFSNLSDEGQRILNNRLSEQKNEIVDQYIKAVREGRSAIAKADVKLEDTTAYDDALVLLVLEAMEYGKIMSANELGKAVPNTTKQQRQSAIDRAMLVIDEQTNKLNFRMKDLANTMLDRKLPENDARVQFEQEFSNFVSTVVPGTIGALIPKGFNYGRQITFDKYESDIFAYRYTAKLENTCQYCMSLDGRVFQVTDPNYYLLTPPQHFNCNCFWSAVTPQEASQYNIRVDGKPSSLPVYGSISQYQNIPEVINNDDSEVIDKLMKLIDE